MLLFVCTLAAFLGVSSGEVQNDGATVAFSAGFTGNRQFQSNELLIFNKVLINYGGGYSSITGIFTAPRAGVYLFLVHALTIKNSSFWLYLYHNNDCVITAFARENTQFDTTGNSAILPLKKNDKVYIKVDGTSLFIGEGNGVYTTLSGYRIGPLREESQ
ncbi:hypothetical protein BsWGS_20268 [Bradybaena similaris]